MDYKVEVIARQFTINDIGQRINFQIDLPKDAKRIIGIEHSAMKLSGVLSSFLFIPGGAFAFYPDNLIGTLTLQVPGVEGAFYRADIKEYRNVVFGDPIAGAGVWMNREWENAKRRDPIEIDVKDNLSFLEGYFEDAWGKLDYSSLTYLLNIYFWVELR